MTVLSAALLLFLVMDPFGNIPLFVSALSGVERERHMRVIIRELLIALGIIVLFLFGGQSLINALGVGEAALSAAGGIVFLLIAIKMVLQRQGGMMEDIDGEPFIVPLAVPYVAGPSALVSTLLIMSREPGRWPEWLAAVGIAWLATGIIIVLSGLLIQRIGRRALIAIERLMGMLLVAIAIQMLLTGIAHFLGTGV